jgi:two-component system, cell cycle response regulator
VISRNKKPPTPNPPIGASGLPNLDNFDYEVTSTRQTETGIVEPASSRRSARMTLGVLAGSDAGRIVPLAAEVTLIGRATSCNLVLPDTGVSRKHASIRAVADGFLLEDLGSKNGLFMDGEQIRTRILRDGDAFQVGPHVVVRLARMTDVEEKLARQLYDSSMRDALTGTFNRRHFGDRLRGEVAFAHRHAAPLSLLTIDFDHFKNINDTHGHSAGDAVLKQGAHRIMSTLRSEDVLARVGGEEFSVILRGISHDAALACAERIRAAVAAAPVLVPRSAAVTMTVSLGVASFDEVAAKTVEGFIELADERLYAAKRAGRNRVHGRR